MPTHPKQLICRVDIADNCDFLSFNPGQGAARECFEPRFLWLCAGGT
jgi:hypothetical protein